MSIEDGAKRLYRDSGLGLTMQAIVAVASTAVLEWLSTLPALASTAVGVAVGTLAGTITAWRAKHVAPPSL